MSDDDQNEHADYQDPPPARTNQLVRRDMMGSSLVSGDNAATQALIAKARADVEARWFIAQRCPRNLEDVRITALNECRRPGFAEIATYARPVGKKQVDGKWVEQFAEGLSIRAAEMLVRALGNIQPDTQTIFDSPGERLTRVTVTDFESNVTWSRDITTKKTIERRNLKKGQACLGERLNSYGDRVFIVEATDDEVAVKEAAMISKTVRTLILRVVPGHIREECFKTCKEVAANRDAKDPTIARTKLLDGLARLGIMPSDVAAFVGYPLEQLTPVDMQRLRAIGTAIHDGETTWAEVSAPIDDAAPAKPKAATKPATVPTTSAPPAPPPPPAGAAPVAPAKPEARENVAPEEIAAANRKIQELATPPGRDPLREDPIAKQRKGTAALKSQMGLGDKPPPAEPPPLVLVPDEIKERPCAGCGVPIDALPGGKCEACRNE